ncbi:hypothetical protein [Peribacillus simplex]|uniref:hypothetical protein n=1 Tax=Peribacillus simplex TaxID=1478 RepID=UPI00285348B3|nr:hypothetical protein [Peribacillus simplex]MDR4926176.1 hypothetical protein [Peribacillus simplex]
MFDITYVFVHRPFEASVRSLANRDGMSIEEATGILIAYQKNKVYFITSDKKDIIDVYFEELVKDPSPFVHKINLRTGREPDYKLDKVLEFIDERLKYF